MNSKIRPQSRNPDVSTQKTIDLKHWAPLTLSAGILSLLLGNGWGEVSLRRKCKSGELPRGRCWIDSGSAISCNPQEIIDYIKEQNNS